MSGFSKSSAIGDAAPGFRIWLIVVGVLTAMVGPVLTSEGWATWDEARRMIKLINWGIGVLLWAGMVFWCLPHRMGWTGHLRVFPWIFVVLFVLVSYFAIGKGSFPGFGELARISFAAAGAVAWFAFLRRYPFVLQADRYSDAEWRKLVK